MTPTTEYDRLGGLLRLVQPFTDDARKRGDEATHDRLMNLEYDIAEEMDRAFRDDPRQIELFPREDWIAGLTRRVG